MIKNTISPLLQEAAPKAIIFDLDGTLVSSNLDFSALSKEVGCSPGDDILKYTESLPAYERRKAEQIIYDYEMKDAASSVVIDGVHDMLVALKQASIDTAIVTRNSAEATSIKLARAGLLVEHVITREEAPPKPAPDALLQVAARWQHSPVECIYVGDFRYDLEAALNANMHAAWFSNGVDTPPSYAQLAHFTFDHYRDFLNRLNDYWQGSE
ncbi:HAD family hydrolase [Alkalimarinus sediminis]|uniref:phosphoglycolate phosphatase n=1 Tax=Alkalimarinus sediminis TaxID=1632866 RepID=A0A9E8HK85_9ALTE|nr:HAD family phosphatase [Alkalimarinus sediminis]UZW75677.1 HAD family phosphatase [Alkalimarinus sediminis]